MLVKSSIDTKKRFKFTAYIGLDRNWWHYYNHYKSAIDHLVIGIEGSLPVNTVSSSLLFLVRHCLELGFKANILKLETISDARPKLTFKGGNSHSLEHLYSVFKDHLVKIQNTHNIEPSIRQKMDEYLNETEKLKNILHQLDKGSYNFRYPVDTDGNYNFEWDEQVNIADIVDAFYKLQPFMIFTDQVLYEHGVFGFE
jgi:hypothetical protein